jgi:hypothetical protein
MVVGSNNALGKMLKNNYKGKYTTPHTSITRNWYPKATTPDI